MKKNNILQQLETHVDKVVLGVVILASLAILWIYVIGNPYGQMVDGRKLGPGQIDAHVKTKADALHRMLDETGDPEIYNKAYLAQYNQLLQSPLSGIASLSIPASGPGGVAGGNEGPRIYVLPEIAALTDVAACKLRGAAQKPMEEQLDEMLLMAATTTDMELEDVDLVTVSANFNVQSLYNAFQQSFMGPRLKTAWKDSSLAKPVFAKLELQRRRLLENGTWDQWQTVHRAKNDTYKKLIEELPQTTDQSQYGVGFWINQFTDKPTQRSILQPQAYSFVISPSEWLPPVYLQEALDMIKKQDEVTQRQLRQERARQRTDMPYDPIGRRGEGMRPGAPTRGERRPPDTRRGRGENPMEMFDPMAAPTRPPTRRERTLNDVKADARKVMLDDQTDPQSMRQALLVWAHDDSAQPGNTYQYRLRLGVFNPVAGKKWLNGDQEQYDNQIVLWSPYTDPTSEMYIPKRIHIFPTELLAAGSNPNSLEGVKVEVAKYNLGQWRMHTFEVFPGQIIGQKAEVKLEQVNPTLPGMSRGMEIMMMPNATNSTEPQVIDFTTPFTFVDVNQLITWGINAQRRNTYDVMLFHDPQLHLKQMAIGRNNWDGDLRSEYQDVQDELEKAGQQQQMPGMPMPFMPGQGGPANQPDRYRGV